MPSPPLNIAIIGAGLSGLSLALALHQQNIPCSIYERHTSPPSIGGAVILSPNALKIIDGLSMYSRIRIKGYNFLTLEYRNGEGKLPEIYEFGGKEKYGYEVLRIYRTVLIDELLTILREVGIRIEFRKRFIRVIKEGEEGIKWEFSDRTLREAGLLVGANGIYSSIRAMLHIPEF